MIRKLIMLQVAVLAAASTYAADITINKIELLPMDEFNSGLPTMPRRAVANQAGQRVWRQIQVSYSGNKAYRGPVRANLTVLLKSARHGYVMTTGTIRTSRRLTSAEDYKTRLFISPDLNSDIGSYRVEAIRCVLEWGANKTTEETTWLPLSSGHWPDDALETVRRLDSLLSTPWANLKVSPKGELLSEIIEGTGPQPVTELDAATRQALARIQVLAEGEAK